MSAGKVSGTVTGGTFSGMFIGVTGAVDRDGVVARDGGGEAEDPDDVEDPEEVGHAETGGQASSLNNFFQLLRHDFSGFAVVTMSEFEA